jgi:hypothetical protein
MIVLRRWLNSARCMAHETLKWVLSGLSAAATLTFVLVLESA